MKQKVSIKTGDTVKIFQKIIEGKKERIINFSGLVVKLRGKDENAMVTVRQELDGVTVDRILPVNIPSLVDIKIIEQAAKMRGTLPVARSL